MSRLAKFREDDQGVVVLLVSLLAGTGLLFIMVALVIDVGALRIERLELRRAADAAVVSAAYDCSFNPTTLVSSNCGTATYPSEVSPQRLSDRNSVDQLGTLYSLCGNDQRTGTTSRLVNYPCDYSAPVNSRDCRTRPAGTANRDYVQAAVQTRTASGARILPWFARFFGSQGSSLYACSQAAFAPPTGLPPTLGLALSKVCWESATSAGANYPAPPPYETAAAQLAAAQYEKALVLPGGNKDGNGPCEKASAGPGGFGFVADADCEVSPSVGTLTADTGASGANCSTIIPKSRYKLVNLPIYSNVAADTGTFQVVGFAPFFLTGWDIPAVDNKLNASVSGVTCPSGDKCLFGWFTQSTLLTDAITQIDPGQASYGLNVVKLVG